MANVSINQKMALEILKTIADNMSGTQQEALQVVAEWIKNNCHDTEMTPEEREARIVALMTAERNRMTPTERRERADWYLEGVA